MRQKVVRRLIASATDALVCDELLNLSAVRQAAVARRDCIDQQRLLELLDSKIDAFNDLIAARCSG
jgi:hypothetical protein